MIDLIVLLFFVVFLVSLLLSSFFGYWIHRALHSKWLRLLNRGHLEHHLEHYPPGRLISDEYRHAKWFNSGPFLFTPPLLVLLAVTGGLLWLFGLPLWMLGVFGATMVGFGLINDAIHDSFHLSGTWLRHFKFWGKLRAQHFAHHHDMKRNFGIVSFEWDKLFKTHKEV